MEFDINPSISNVEEGFFILSFWGEIVFGLEEGFGAGGIEELFGGIGEDVKWARYICDLIWDHKDAELERCHLCEGL